MLKDHYGLQNACEQILNRYNAYYLNQSHYHSLVHCDQFCFHTITRSEVDKPSSIDRDIFPKEVYYYAPDFFSEKLKDLINHFIHNSYFPNRLKEAMVNPNF